MRRIFLSFLLAGAAQADEMAAPPPVAAQDAQIKVQAATNPPASLFEADKLRKQRAPLEIALLRAMVRDSKVERGFFSSLFSAKVNQLDIDLLVEMDSFIDRFAELAETAEIYQLKAQVNLRMNAYPQAAINELMLQAAYPDSSFVTEAQKGLKALSDDKLKKQALLLKVMSDTTKSLSGDQEQRVATYLIFLGSLREADFAAAIAAECALFLARNQTFLDEDKIEHALAHQKMLYSPEMAVFHFKKLLALYPASPLRADSQLSVGLIEREALKRYAGAVASFKTVIADFPDADEARLAYESLANTYDEDLRDYGNAIATYESIAARYKNDAVVLRSLQSLARLYQDKTHQLARALATYLRVYDIFKGREGLAALVKAQKIAVSNLNDWNQAIEINELIMRAYPDSDEAVTALYGNGVIYEENKKEIEHATRLYQDLINRYPQHELSKESRRRISALTQKR